MPGKLYLILTTLTTILVLLSFWGIPLLLFWCAYDWITILWELGRESEVDCYLSKFPMLNSPLAKYAVGTEAFFFGLRR